MERLGSVLGSQVGSQIDQKSINIEFPMPSVSASFFTSIFDRFLLPTSTPWISKKYVFPKEKQCFFKKPPFEDNIDFGFDFGANLPPCCPPKSKIFRFLEVPRGLQNPTSPLGLGGLAWGVCFSTPLLSTILVSTLWGGVYPFLYPCIETPPLT